MAGNDRLVRSGEQGGAEEQWAAQWELVPPPWRSLVYHLDKAPASALFVPNPRYRPVAEGHDFTPAGAPQRICHELAWWVWLCGEEDTRKVEPSLLKWTSRALGIAAADYRQQHRRPLASIADLTPESIVRHGVLDFERRNGRLPSPGFRTNVTNFVEHLHLHVAVRCTARPWWDHDIWNLYADPRIPRREHEPQHDQVVRLGGIEPAWLRNGVRFWLRTALTAELLRWSSLTSRVRDVSRHLGPFLATRRIDDPALNADRAAVPDR